MQTAAALNAYAKDVHSQTGEDGILERIFEILGHRDRWCVEFGAVDGRTLSNTLNLVEKHGWSSILIEGNPRKHRKLQRSFSDNPRVHSLCAMVGYEDDQRLDALLKKTPIPKEFSFLSVDVDGVDYYIWEALKEYRPRLVVIEFNPTIPVDIDWVQPRDMSLSQGSSLKAFVRLAKTKGYELICATDFNAFFVVAEDFSKFEVPNNSPEALWDGKEFQTRLFQLFDGTIVLDGCDHLLWHGVRMSPRRMQILPRFLRKFPGRLHPVLHGSLLVTRGIARWLAR